jgi:hypothetical protein
LSLVSVYGVDAAPAPTGFSQRLFTMFRHQHVVVGSFTTLAARFPLACRARIGFSAARKQPHFIEFSKQDNIAG